MVHPAQLSGPGSRPRHPPRGGSTIDDSSPPDCRTNSGLKIQPRCIWRLLTAVDTRSKKSPYKSELNVRPCATIWAWTRSPIRAERWCGEARVACPTLPVQRREAAERSLKSPSGGTACVEQAGPPLGEMATSSVTAGMDVLCREMPSDLPLVTDTCAHHATRDFLLIRYETLAAPEAGDRRVDLWGPAPRAGAS